MVFSLYNNKRLKPSRFTVLITAHNLEETKGKSEEGKMKENKKGKPHATGASP